MLYYLQINLKNGVICVFFEPKWGDNYIPPSAAGGALY